MKKLLYHLLFGYIKVFTKEGKLLIAKPILNNHYCDIQLQACIQNYGIDNLVVKASKRGLKRLFNNYIVFLDGKTELGRKHITAEDIVNAPITILDISHFIIKDKNVISFDESWLCENQKEFARLFAEE